MTSDEDPRQPPAVRASDADRQAAVARLHTAVAEGRIDLHEFGERVAAADAASTTAELDALLADLPAEGAATVEIVGSRAPESITSTFGDVKLEGVADPPRQVSTVFGDVRLDLRGLRTDAAEVEIVVHTVFGDVDVILAEGVAGELQGWSALGDRRTRLAAVPRLAGTPRVVVRARTVFGDVTLRSLAPGESASRWRALLDRLAQRLQPPPPPPPLT